MEKLKQLIKKVMPDQLSVFIILGVYAVTIFISVAIYSLQQYNRVIATNGSINFQEEINTNQYGSITDFKSVENITDVKELEKLNQNEIKEVENETKESVPPYYIKVNYGAQVVTIYGLDTEGNYTIPVKAMTCSTGTYTPTEGVYQVPAKIRWCDMIGDVYAQYCTQIVGDILFHSVPYTVREDHSSLEWWAYDQLGTKASLGCIRLTCEDAKWIYENCRIGTQVEFYCSDNPGPLGKPSTPKISDAPDYVKGWDPTDQAEGNPWGEYLEELEKKKKEEEERRKQEEAQKIKVPNVIGMTELKAKDKLLNFKIKIVYDSDESQANGIVLEQSLEPGKSVKKNTEIILTVNQIIEEPPIEDPEKPGESEKPGEPEEPEEPDKPENPDDTNSIVDSNTVVDSNDSNIVEEPETNVTDV